MKSWSLSVVLEWPMTGGKHLANDMIRGLDL